MQMFSLPKLLQVFFGVAATLTATLFLSVAAAQGSRDVIVIDPPQPTPNDGTIEVLEFFSYGCSHCANLEPPLETWAKKLPTDVKMRRVPSGFNMMGVDEVPLFYTLEAMGQIDRLHKKIFDALHNERVILGNKATLLKWLEKNGVAPAQYESVEKSFSVQTKVARGKQMAGLYKITSTPTIVVNGRIAAVQVGGATGFLTTIDRYIDEARQSNAKGAVTKAPVASAMKATAPASK
ncbi:MAG: thiol:disulfide interchange protein DsbA/DsbL [Aeromicrobium sp.]|nr:thiol:disulfide interchange protein DsbA/DsbL [Burkholderiales bacterium]